MKHLFKRGFSLLCVLAVTVSMLCIAPLTASAEEVVPTALVRQNLAKWKNYVYGDSQGTLYRTGCGMFAIVNSVGYLTGNVMDVTEVAAWGHAIGGYNPGNTHQGTYRGVVYPKLQAKYGERYGFTVDCNGSEGYWAGSSSSRLKNHLAKGGVAIGHVPGHFIAVVGWNGSKYHVYDSYPTTARGTGTGDCWVTPTQLATGKLKLDWYCLLSSTGTVINNKPVSPTPDSTAAKLGTYKITTPVDDPLNVRSGPATTYDIVDTTVFGDVIDVKDLSGNWGKFTTVNKGVEGWASIKNYGEYIGVDCLAQTQGAAWGTATSSVDSLGRLTLVNNSSEQLAYDFTMPFDIGTATTPFLSTRIRRNFGTGYYFGVSQRDSGFFMMRDCNSGDEMVNATTAGYMTGDEVLEINMDEWWTSKTSDYRINLVRFYLAPNTSITIDYLYFAAGDGVVIDETYNLLSKDRSATGETVAPVVNENLMDPETLAIVTNNRSGSYSYQKGTLEVVSDTDAGYEVSFNVDWDYTPEVTKYLVFDLSSDVPCDVYMTVTTADGDRTFGLVADFWPSLCAATVNDCLPAGTYTNHVDMYSCYTWNNIVPEDGISTVKSITVKAAGKGTVTVRELQVADNDVLVTYTDNITREGSSSGVSVGDVNADGTVSTQDAREILKHTVSIVTLSGNALAAADFNGDGKVDTLDAREMLLSLISSS